MTSSQFNYLLKDPFTAGERLEMIHESLQSDVDLTKCFLVPIENQFNIATWASYLEATLPKFDRVYSGNEYVSMLLADSGYKVIEPQFYDREKFNATRIRNLMINDGEWENLVPNATSEFIKKIDGVNRLKIISKSDTKPTEH